MSAQGWPGRAPGFTLVELVVVIVLLGVIAAIAAPRFLGQAAFSERGFSDEVRAALRYAQKVAVAQRRIVCVAFSGAPPQVSLVYAPAGACNGAPIPAPGTGTPFTLAAPNGVAINAPGGNIAFNGLGQPVTPAGLVVAVAQNVNVTGRLPIVVEPETGHVR